MAEDKRFCKKCHCELSDYSKGKLCDNCRKKRNAKLKKGGGIAATVIATITSVVTAVILGKNKNNN